MTFHRNRERSLAFKRWRSRAQGWLLASGVPGDLYATLDAWWYFIEHGALPGVYSADADAALLASEERQIALVAAVLTTPGASEQNVRDVLPPCAFAHLWRPVGVGYVLTDAARRLVTAQSA